MQEKIEKLSSILYSRSTPYRFKKEQGSFDRGYLKVNFWIDELCIESLENDKNIQKSFDEKIEKLKRWLETLQESEYKEGMKKALSDADYGT